MVDDEEEFEKLCSSCKSKSKIRRCSGCGDKVKHESSNNPNFDDNKFEEMKKKSENGGDDFYE